MSAPLLFAAKRPLVLVALLGSFHVAAAGATTVDFTSVPQQSANGVTLDGVTFGYTEFGSPSPTAQIDEDVGPGATQLVPEFALVGNTDGVLTLVFAQTVSKVSFAVAETTNLPLTPGFSVSVFDTANNLLQSTDIDTNPLVLFSEGAFTYDGPPASSISIAFDSVDANQFAFGGLTYAAPEPSSIAVLGAGLLGLGAIFVRRRQVRD
jgi:hypothetical protein